MLKSKCYYHYNKAIRKGWLVKDRCEICFKSKVNAHHPNHYFPIKVIWLCSKCHIKLHGLLKGNEKFKKVLLKHNKIANEKYLSKVQKTKSNLSSR